MKKAFTIVELLIVIIVIAILAVLAIISFSGITQKATVASIQADLGQNSKKLKLYYSQYGSYPTSLDSNNCPTLPVSDGSFCLKTSGSNSVYSYSATTSTFVLKIANGTVLYRVNESEPPVQANTYTLTLSVNGSGGSVSGGGVFEVNSVQTIVASPDSLYQFGSWSGSPGCSGASSHTVTITGDISCVATFNAMPTLAGGSLTSDATYYYRTFTNNGNLVISNASISVDYLIVGGGGGGGADQGGGGGAGGYYSGSISLPVSSQSIVIGGGGGGASAGTANNGSGGGNTTAFGITAYGGQGGMGLFRSGQSGGNLGSGQVYYSGGVAYGDISGGAGGAGAASNGSNASSFGRDSSSGYAGGGGSGTVIFGYGFGGGGGGGNRTSTQRGSAGSYGGGLGGACSNGSNATPNTGGGGGGGSWCSYQYAGGSGGSGIVIVRYTRSQVGG